MNVSCSEIQDRLPERAAGRLEPARSSEVDQHLRHCSECREAFETVRLLTATRPPVPSDLEARILAAVRDASVATASGAPRRRWLDSHHRWGWAAAAVLALAVGLPVLSTMQSGDGDEIGALALAEEEVGGVWLDDDLMVAGAPAVSELSDEALRQLLEEFER